MYEAGSQVRTRLTYGFFDETINREEYVKLITDICPEELSNFNYNRRRTIFGKFYMVIAYISKSYCDDISFPANSSVYIIKDIDNDGCIYVMEERFLMSQEETTAEFYSPISRNDRNIDRNTLPNINANMDLGWNMSLDSLNSDTLQEFAEVMMVYGASYTDDFIRDMSNALDSAPNTPTPYSPSHDADGDSTFIEEERVDNSRIFRVRGQEGMYERVIRRDGTTFLRRRRDNSLETTETLDGAINIVRGPESETRMTMDRNGISFEVVDNEHVSVTTEDGNSRVLRGRFVPNPNRLVTNDSVNELPSIPNEVIRARTENIMRDNYITTGVISADITDARNINPNPINPSITEASDGVFTADALSELADTLRRIPLTVWNEGTAISTNELPTSPIRLSTQDIDDYSTLIRPNTTSSNSVNTTIDRTVNIQNINRNEHSLLLLDDYFNDTIDFNCDICIYKDKCDEYEEVEGNNNSLCGIVSLLYNLLRD